MVSRFACDDHPKGEDDGKKIWIFVFMEASAGIVVAKGKASRAIGIPLTKSGRQRKAGRLLGDLVGTALIAVKELFAKPSIGSRPRKTRPDLDADLATWLANREAAEQTGQHYWLLLRNVARLGEPLENAARRNPELTRGQTETAGHESAVLSGSPDEFGKLRILAYGGRVYRIEVAFPWVLTLEELVNATAPYFRAPDAEPISELDGGPGWVCRNDDELFLAKVIGETTAVSLSVHSVVCELFG